MSDLRAFLTGSHAYGIPGKGSDIDLVVFVSEKDMDKLLANCEENVYSKQDADYEKCLMRSLRFGELNLLCCTDLKVYQAWKVGTIRLKKQAPVSRSFAIGFMRKIREAMKL